MARDVHVYFNRQDVALGVSDGTKPGNMPRLGDGGIRLPAQAPARVTQIDCTPVVHGVWEHGYLRKNAAVLADIREVLKGRDPDEIENRRFMPARGCYQLLEEDS